ADDAANRGEVDPLRLDHGEDLLGGLVRQGDQPGEDADLAHRVVPRVVDRRLVPGDLAGRPGRLALAAGFAVLVAPLDEDAEDAAEAVLLVLVAPRFRRLGD